MSFREYIEAGWRLCAIDRGKKAPLYANWNTEPLSEEAADGVDGAGLLHALSGTCALDIDNIELARPWLAERGVGLDALLADERATQIVSGRPGRAKLLYRMKRPLRTFKPKGSGLELRCANAEGKSVQDVLPPTIHPDTKKPYEWGGLLADWRELTPVPASLLSMWREMAEGDETPADIPSERPRASIDLAKLSKAAFKHSPDCEYDEWIKVGMQLHDGTGGAQEGFDIWCQWSRGITRAKYPGDSSLKSHWLSFSSEGKHAAKAEALLAELPADADEFDVVEDVPEGTPTTEDLVQETKKEARAKAADILLKRLVYVASANKYFDLEEHCLIGGGNDAIQHQFTHLMPGGGLKKVDPVKILKSKGARRVRGVGFHPGEAVLFQHDGQKFVNLFRPESLPALVQPTSADLERIEFMFDRLDDPIFREWLIQFFGHVIQRPGMKIMSAPLIWSEITGNGKSTLMEFVPKLLVGGQYFQSVGSKELESGFNGYLVGKWCIALKEFRAFSRGERSNVTEKLKDLITGETIALRQMYTDAYDMPNHFFLTASSNHMDAAALDNEDRRWAVHEMHARAMTQREVQWLYHEFLLTERARGVLRSYFLDVSLAGFTASAKAPETAARAAMIAASKGVDEEFLATAMEQYTSPLEKDVVLLSDVVDYIRRHTPARSMSNERAGRLLTSLGGKKLQIRDGDARFWVTIIRDHDRWTGAPGKEVMQYIHDGDIDLLS